MAVQVKTHAIVPGQRLLPKCIYGVSFGIVVMDELTFSKAPKSVYSTVALHMLFSKASAITV